MRSGIQAEELRALFARELAHIQMWHVRAPRSWLVLQGSGISGVLDAVWKNIPDDVAAQLQLIVAQLVEVCRARSAISIAVARTSRLPEGLRPMVTAGSEWIRLGASYGAMADVCDLLEAPSSAMVKVQTAWSLLKRLREASSGSLEKRRDSGGFGSVLLTRRRPKSTRDTLPARLAIRPAVLLLLSIKRVGELAADRAASKAVGGIEPVVAALVRVYGTEDERRRLDRGDVRGIIEASRAALGARGGLLRWELWWQSLVEGPADPPLALRVADLAAWAELGEHGRFRPWHLPTSSPAQATPGAPAWPPKDDVPMKAHA